MKSYLLKEIYVISKNEPGSLHTIVNALGLSGVNIEAIVAYARDEKTAIFRIITADPATTKRKISFLPNVFSVGEEDVIVVILQNKAGELSKVTEKLTKAGVNLETVYIINKTNEFAEVAIKPYSAHLKKAMEVLNVKQ